MKLAKHSAANVSEMEQPSARVARAHANGVEHLASVTITRDRVGAAPLTLAAGSPLALPPPVSEDREDAAPQALPTNGSKPAIILKKLSNRHKMAIALTLQGKDRAEVAEATDFKPEYITFLLQQPLAKAHIAHVNKALDTQLEGLYGKSVAAIAGGLNHLDPDVALRAAKLQLQVTGRLEPKDEDKHTAEDIVSQILLGVQVNVNTKEAS